MSLFTGIVNVVKTSINFVKGNGGSFSDFAINLATQIPMVIAEIKNIFAMKADGLDDGEKYKLVKSALVEFDNMTGVEGMSFFGSDTPTEKANEENALDNLTKFIWFTTLHELKLPFVEYDSITV